MPDAPKQFTQEREDPPGMSPPRFPRRVTQVIDTLLYLIRRFRPIRRHPFFSGEQTISTATTTTGTYEDTYNFTNDLGFPAIAGCILNKGPGVLFFVISASPNDMSGNEVRLEPGMAYVWGGPDNPHQIAYMHVRADTADTKYEIVAGAGKQEFRKILYDRLNIKALATLTFTNVTGANASPDTDTAIVVEQARSIWAQIDSTNANNTATDTDLNIIASGDGTTFDDGVAGIYTAKNFGDSEVLSMLIEPGPKEIKGRVDENGSLRADLTATFYVRE